MSRTRELPRWLVALIVVAAVVVLGPTLLHVVFGALGLALGLAAVLLKLGLVVFAVYAVVVLLRAIFGGALRASS